MRKLLIFIFLIFFGFSAYAGFGPQNPTSPAGGAPSSPCPSWYADANVVLSWDGDYPGSTLTACNSAGTAVVFTSSNADISTYGENGSNALKCDDSLEYMSYQQTAGQYVDYTADQTICFKVAMYGPFDNISYYAYIYDTGGDDRQRYYFSAGEPYDIVDDWDTQSASPVTAAGNDYINATPWQVIAYTWDESGDRHATNTGNQGLLAWPDGWEEDSEALDTMTDNAMYIFFGTNPAGDPGDTKYYIIDAWAVVNGYQFDCSTLTGW